ncbi:hypothetical protein ACP4OV_002133 [Aristida adscensionis]
MNLFGDRGVQAAYDAVDEQLRWCTAGVGLGGAEPGVPLVVRPPQVLVAVAQDVCLAVAPEQCNLDSGPRSHLTHD